MFLELEIFAYVPLIHPLGDQAQPVFPQCRTKEWEDVLMSKVFPGYSLFTKPLSHIAWLVIVPE